MMDLAAYYEESIVCEFCGKQIVRSDAINEGWTPYFWDSMMKEERGAACPTCTVTHLVRGDYEMVMLVKG